MPPPFGFDLGTESPLCTVFLLAFRLQRRSPPFFASPDYTTERILLLANHHLQGNPLCDERVIEMHLFVGAYVHRICTDQLSIALFQNHGRSMAPGEPVWSVKLGVTALRAVWKRVGFVSKWTQSTQRMVTSILLHLTGQFCQTSSVSTFRTRKNSLPDLP